MLEQQSGATRREEPYGTDFVVRLLPRCDQLPKPVETPVTRCFWQSLDHLVQNRPKIKRNTCRVVRYDRVHQCQGLSWKLGTDAGAAMAAIVGAGDALIRAEARVAALVAPSQRADLALSESARELRLRLEPGAPCPVCGSAEHPIHADAALADLASTLRADLANARQAERTSAAATTWHR